MSRYKVLIVEDEHIIRKNIVSKVSRASDSFYVCADVSSGMEAWNLVQTLIPDVVFVDINIPEIDGLELVRLIRNRYPEIITIIISGYSSFDYARRAISHGVSEYLLKPVKQDSIDNVLEKIKLKLGTGESGTISVTPFGGDNNRSLNSIENIGDTKEIARKVKDYITDNYTTAVNIEEIARIFAFSQTYLTKIFKKHCETTPLKYLISLRIDRAKQMLVTNSEMDIGKVAHAVGYDDQHYFSRLFKNVVGKSPSDYRKGMELHK